MTTETGDWALAHKHMAASLANCDEWQDWTGANNATQAASRVFQESPTAPRYSDTYSLDELQSLRPYAVIETPDDGAFRMAFTARGTTIESGALLIFIQADVPEAIADQPDEIALRIRNRIGTLAQELMANRETAGYLAINSIEVIDISRTPKNEHARIGDAIDVQLRVEWGGAGE